MVQSFGSAAVDKSKSVAPSHVIVLADGGPLGVKAEFSCDPKLSGDSTVYDIKLLVHIVYGVDAKPIEQVSKLNANDLLRDSTWSPILESTVSSCVSKLESRGLNVAPEYRSLLREALTSARKNALLLMIRSFARYMIEAVPASEACQVWMEEEAKLMFDS